MARLIFSNRWEDRCILPSKVNTMQSRRAGGQGVYSTLKAGVLALLVSAAALAQIYPPVGGYPGQTPYPGQSPYPGGRPGGTGIPMPGRTSRKQPAPDKNGPLPNFRGVLKVMDEKSLSVELGDNRILDFKRTGSTKFFKNGDEVKTPNFNVGDQVSVEAQEQPGGYMNAVNVYWEKAASGTATKPADDSTVDTWKDVPRTSNNQGSAGSSQTVTPAADDPGPPKLRRGGAADPSREVAAPPPAQETARVVTPAPTAPAVRGTPPPAEDRPVTIIRGDNDEDTSSLRTSIPKDEPLIRRAADGAMEFTETLPSYVCTEMIARFQSVSRPANFQPIDVVSTEVVYENGREDYRNIQINGKPTKRKIEETGGAWSTGEFGTVLVNLFNPATAANFHFRRDSRAGGIMAKMYDFEVDREHSHWDIHAASQEYMPAYTGSIWIDPATARVLRIEMEAKGMPGEFPLDHVESATDYSYVRLGDAKQYLLPVHSEILSCERGTNNCSRNVIDFRNYHKYTGESTITFGGTAKDK